MKLTDMTFHRLFSKSLYKNLKLPLGEMTFSRDFVTDTNGDLYPLAEKSADCDEAVVHTFDTQTFTCVIPIWQGSRMRCYWLTFDRHQGSDYTWSYGNLYGFEAIEN